MKYSVRSGYGDILECETLFLNGHFFYNNFHMFSHLVLVKSFQIPNPSPLLYTDILPMLYILSIKIDSAPFQTIGCFLLSGMNCNLYQLFDLR